MMGLVAAVVAIVILVFFGLGYLFGRLFSDSSRPALTTLPTSKMTVALFGITNDALNLAVNLLILFLVVLWLALVAWTFFDARRRIADPVLIACATAASLFPFVGSIVYSILRPPEFLADKRERELEMRASALRVRQLEESSCPELRAPRRAQFPALPQLPGADQGPVRVLRQADRSPLGDLPLLRDPAAQRRAAA